MTSRRTPRPATGGRLDAGPGAAEHTLWEVRNADTTQHTDPDRAVAEALLDNL